MLFPRKNTLPLLAVTLLIAAWSGCSPLYNGLASSHTLGETLLPASSTLPAGPVPLVRAHAHNDYEHDRPLQDALDQGFTSVEADIYLINGELLVAHDLEGVQPDRTLQSLYLDPLRERVNQNGGQIYVNGPQFTLLIDIKSEAEATYTVLREALKEYEVILSTFGPDGPKGGPVIVIISGNRPREVMAIETVRYAYFDGRLKDLGSDAPATFIPLISDRWSAHFTWSGEGAMPPEERKKLIGIIDAAHAEGRRVRFWATPDKPSPARKAVWLELLAAGVDLINTDDLEGLQQFLLEHDPILSRDGIGCQIMHRYPPGKRHYPVVWCLWYRRSLPRQRSGYNYPQWPSSADFGPQCSAGIQTVWLSVPGWLPRSGLPA